MVQRYKFHIGQLNKLMEKMNLFHWCSLFIHKDLVVSVHVVCSLSNCNASVFIYLSSHLIYSECTLVSTRSCCCILISSLVRFKTLKSDIHNLVLHCKMLDKTPISL